MKHVDEYREPDRAAAVAERIRHGADRPMRFMEFCGGHTAAIVRNGIRQLLPAEVGLLSGPGCPVCVTPPGELDRAIAIAGLPDVVLATFGDMVKVPGSTSSLQRARAEGCDVRVVYSALDAMEMARQNPEKSIVLVGIGFETTAPTVAASVLDAARQGLKNYYVLSLHKICPPVMKALLDSGEVRFDGIICPGHVSAIIGSHPYDFIARDYGIGCVVSGFEPLDILLTVEMLVEQVRHEKPSVEIEYRRGVRPEGNPHALRLMDQVFEVCDAQWRGVGSVPASGLRLRPAYEAFDAEKAFPVVLPPPIHPRGCICGDILRGVSTPYDCGLFGRICTAESPVGPCMVSSEGACAAYLAYGGKM